MKQTSTSTGGDIVLLQEQKNLPQLQNFTLFGLLSFYCSTDFDLHMRNSQSGLPNVHGTGLDVLYIFSGFVEASVEKPLVFQFLTNRVLST